MILSQHLSKEQGIPDLLNYAHFVDDGVIINKDGAFLVSYQFRAPDINSATQGELEGLAESINRTVLSLEDGWMIHVDELRIPSNDYPSPESSYFKSSVAQLIDDERRKKYQLEGAHYENLQYITFVWKLPLPLVKTTKHWFVENLPNTEDSQNLSKLLNQFTETVERCLGLLNTQLKFVKLNCESLLCFLNTCLTGELLPVDLPEWFKDYFCFVDTLLGRKPLVGGYIPKIGNKYIYVLSVLGYVNQYTQPGLLEEMSIYPLVYRWSNRFIPLSESTAETEINRYQKHWHNKIKGLLGTIKEALFSKPSSKVNQDAVEMVDETQLALTSNSNHSTRFGYWTSSIVIMNEDQNVIVQAIKSLQNYLEKKGFNLKLEDVNALDAWLGSIPGHGSANVRRLFIDSYNLAHVLPLHTLWTGNAITAGSSLLPKNSPPVFYANTTGYTPFRFHCDVGDVGHILVVGPTGSGKSTFLQFLMAQFLRYEGAKIFVFDNNYSHKGLTAALDGNHYNIGNSDNLENALSFSPLAELSTDAQKLRAGQFIESLVQLQGIKLDPDIRQSISDENTQINNRNLTIFRSIVQHSDVKSALQFYTLDGAFKLMDATSDCLQDKSSYLHTFEMSWLLAQRPEIYLPVLMHSFNHITKYIEETKGKYPTLIPLEESWKYIKHPVFAEQLLDWQKTLRKGNGRLVFITTSLSDLYDPATQSLTQLTASILESCPTKIYLPNPSMEESMKTLYSKMGLNDKQIQIIKEAEPKKHYYVVTPEGNRLIDLGFEKGSVILDFIGLSQEESEKLIKSKEKQKNEVNEIT
jgi:type IV secretion/conjugal transfer VirB4 family ATPase